MPFQDKQTLKQQNNYVHHQCQEEESFLFKNNHQKNDKSIRPSLSKNNHEDQIFLDKQKFRNKSLLSRNIKRAKKSYLFA